MHGGLSTACVSKSPSARKIRLGSFLIELEALSAQDFVGFAVEAILDARCREMTYLEGALSDTSTYPAYWIEGYEEYRRRFRKSAQNPEFCVPIECSADSVEGGFGATQRALGEYGRLLTSWEDIWHMAVQKKDVLMKIGAEPTQSPHVTQS
jgi:hypothetical protein